MKPMQPQPIVRRQNRPQPVVQQQPVQYVQYPAGTQVQYAQQQQPVQGQPVQYVQYPAGTQVQYAQQPMVEPQVQYVQQPVVVQQSQYPANPPPQGQATQVQYPADPSNMQPIETGPMESKTKSRIAEACGDTKCERLICGISVFLWFLAFVEIPALFIFATSFRGAEQEGCCGIIKEESYPLSGATCFESDIVNGTIPWREVNGSILCELGGEICLDYTFQIDELDDNVNKTYAIEYNSLDACLEGGGYELSELCGTTKVDKFVKENGIKEAIAMCYAAVVIAIITNLCSVCDWCGAFKNMKCCTSTKGQACWKFAEILCWLAILLAVTQEVENPAANGYEAENVNLDSAEEEPYDNRTYNAVEMEAANENYASMDIPVEWYVHNVCGIDRGEDVNILWIDYDISVPEWVLSDAYGTVAYCGIALSVTEMILFFVWLCSCKKKEDNQQNVQKAIQMT